MTDEKTILNVSDKSASSEATTPQIPTVSPFPVPQPLSGISAPPPVSLVQKKVETPSNQVVDSVASLAQNTSSALAHQVQVEGTKQAESSSVKDTKTAGLYDNNFAADLNLPPKILETKVMGSVIAGLFFFGLMMGCLMSGGEVVQTTNGLGGVVFNPEVREGTFRCGTVPLTRGCVLYIMNAKNYDRKGSDFYQEAQNITGVPSYTIQLSNVRYAATPIEPGRIAQIYIPPR